MRIVKAVTIPRSVTSSSWDSSMATVQMLQNVRSGTNTSEHDGQRRPRITPRSRPSAKRVAIGLTRIR